MGCQELSPVFNAVVLAFVEGRRYVSICGVSTRGFRANIFLVWSRDTRQSSLIVTAHEISEVLVYVWRYLKVS